MSNDPQFTDLYTHRQNALLRSGPSTTPVPAAHWPMYVHYDGLYYYASGPAGPSGAFAPSGVVGGQPIVGDDTAYAGFATPPSMLRHIFPTPPTSTARLVATASTSTQVHQPLMLSVESSGVSSQSHSTVATTQVEASVVAPTPQVQVQKSTKKKVQVPVSAEWERELERRRNPTAHKFFVSDAPRPEPARATETLKATRKRKNEVSVEVHHDREAAVVPPVFAVPHATGTDGKKRRKIDTAPAPIVAAPVESKGSRKVNSTKRKNDVSAEVYHDQEAASASTETSTDAKKRRKLDDTAAVPVVKAAGIQCGRCKQFGHRRSDKRFHPDYERPMGSARSTSKAVEPRACYPSPPSTRSPSIRSTIVARHATSVATLPATPPATPRIATQPTAIAKEGRQSHRAAPHSSSPQYQTPVVAEGHRDVLAAPFMHAPAETAHSSGVNAVTKDVRRAPCIGPIVSGDANFLAAPSQAPETAGTRAQAEKCGEATNAQSVIADRPVVAGSIDILAGLFEQSHDTDGEHDDLFSDVD